jgi:hypothetical protein
MAKRRSHLEIGPALCDREWKLEALEDAIENLRAEWEQHLRPLLPPFVPYEVASEAVEASLNLVPPWVWETSMSVAATAPVGPAEATPIGMAFLVLRLIATFADGRHSGPQRWMAAVDLRCCRRAAPPEWTGEAFGIRVVAKAGTPAESNCAPEPTIATRLIPTFTLGRLGQAPDPEKLNPRTVSAWEGTTPTSAR